MNSELKSNVLIAIQNARDTHHSALTFDLHPLYASILKDGATVREGEVLGLDGDLRRVLVAPFAGTVRLLVTGQGDARRVRVFLTKDSEQPTASRRLTTRDTTTYLHENRN